MASPVNGRRMDFNHMGEMEMMETLTAYEKLLTLAWVVLTVIVTWVWKISSHKHDIDAKLNTVQGLQERVEALTNRTCIMESSTQRLEGRVDSLASRASAMESSTQRLEERLDGVESLHSALTASVGNIQREQAVMLADLRNICRSLDEIKQNLRDMHLSRMPGGRRSYDGQATSEA